LALQAMMKNLKKVVAENQMETTKSFKILGKQILLPSVLLF